MTRPRVGQCWPRVPDLDMLTAGRDMDPDIFEWSNGTQVSYREQYFTRQLPSTGDGRGDD